MENQQNLLTLAYVVLFLATCLFVLGAYLTWSTIELHLYGVETQGEYAYRLYGVKSCGSDVYSFTDASGLKHYAGTACIAPNLGNLATVIYLPSNPDINIVPTPSGWMQGPILLMLSIFLGLASFAGFQGQKTKA